MVRLVAAALGRFALGTVGAALIAPFLWCFKASRELVADLVTKVAVVVVVFVLARFALEILIKWSHLWSIHVVLLVAYYLAFAVALCIPRAREQVVTSLDGFLSEKMTRRTAIATVVGTAAVVATEFVFAKSAPVVKAALTPQRPKSNFLLITFDALAAEDMSLYGRKLPTTPNIDAFAHKEHCIYKRLFRLDVHDS